MKIELIEKKITILDILTKGSGCKNDKEKVCGAYIFTYNGGYCKLFEKPITEYVSSKKFSSFVYPKRLTLCKEYFKRDLVIEDGKHKVIRVLE